jgi:hypothetical protein
VEPTKKLMRPMTDVSESDAGIRIQQVFHRHQARQPRRKNSPSISNWRAALALAARAKNKTP